MIALSAVLVVVATITLVIGIFNTGYTFIAVSIASSLLAFGALLLGVFRGRKEPLPSVSIPEPYAAAREHEAIPVEQAEEISTPSLMLDEEDQAEEEEAEEVPALAPLRLDTGARRSRPSPARPKSTASRAKSAAKKTTAKTTAKKTTAKSAKPAAKKTTARPARTAAKPAAAKPAARKPSVRKPAARKPATRRTTPDQNE